MRSTVRKFGSLLLVSLALIACVAGLYVSSANRELVTIDLLFWPAVTVRSGLLIVLAFVVGALVGMTVAGLAAAAKMRRQEWQAASQRSRGRG